MFTENNPFTPSFGRVPPHMAGRKLLTNDLAKAFSGNGNDPYLQTIFVGARGTGKTAILARTCSIAEERGWISVSTTCSEGMLDDLYQQAVAAASHLVDAAERPRLKGVGIGQILEIEWEPAVHPSANWRTKMAYLLDALAETGTGLVLTVDEVRPRIGEMERLASVFQHFVSEGRRVALVMAGLPHQVSQLVSSDAVSFLGRASLVALGRIEDEDIEDALRKTIVDGGKQIDRDALQTCVAAIGGFPYMMQLVGFRAWDASGEAVAIANRDAELGVEAARRDMERQILIPAWASLSNGDKAFCKAMSSGCRTAIEIAQFMEKKPNYVSKYKQRLLEQGVIEQDVYSRLDFSLPGFLEFVKRAE